MLHFKTKTLKALATATMVAGLGFASPAVADNILRIANFGEPDTLDPHNVSGTWENRILGDMFLGLTTEDAKGAAIPGAAESWTISEDGKVYTFKIRAHNWSDGTPVTADDFVFSLRRILSPEQAAKYASLLFPIKNAEDVNGGKLAKEELGVRAINASTLEITLNAPTPYFLEQLTHYTAWPVPKHLVEKYGSNWTDADKIATNGAYVLDEYVPNTHVKISRNPGFYDAANVSIDGVVFYPQEDRAAAIKRFRSGEVDVLTDFPSEQIKWLRENLADETHIAPYQGIYYYSMNTRKPPFDDARVRIALSMGLNREIITDKLMGTGEIPAYSFVPPGTANYPNPGFIEWKDLPYGERIEQAKALLAQAGYTDKNPLKFTLRYNTSENHKRIAVAATAMWKKQLPVEVELFNSEVKVHYNDIEEGDFQMARAGWIADYNDAQNFLYLMEGKTGANNYAGYDNPDYNDLMAEAAVTNDLVKRAALLSNAESVAMADQPVMPIYYYVSKNLVSKRLQGWQDAPNDVHRTRWMSLSE